MSAHIKKKKGLALCAKPIIIRLCACSLSKLGGSFSGCCTHIFAFSFVPSKEDLEINVVMAEDGEKTTISVCQGRAVDEPLSDKEIDNFSPNELTPATD